MCEMVGQFIQKKHEEEQANDARYWKILACFNDDDDYNFAITTNEPVDSLIPNLSESKGKNGFDVHACFTTFSNIIFNVDYEFDSSDDQSLYDKDVLEKIFSIPLFEEEIIPMKIDQHHFNAESDLIESLLNHDSSIIPSSSKIDSPLNELDVFGAWDLHCGGLPEIDHCQPPQYTVNHQIFNAHNDLLISQTKLMEQITSMCEMVGQFIQKKHEKEQANDARYWKILACFNDDDDYNFAITTNEPIDSLSMGDKHLNTISTMESDEYIKSCVENLVPNLKESKGENGCDVHACFTTFSNIIFNVDYEFDSSDDQSLYDKDVLEKIFSIPLFEEEIIPMKIDQHHFNAESDLIESLLNHDSSIIPSSL
nr:hypothetical protein [Tanacetum cinerariifolium]